MTFSGASWMAAAGDGTGCSTLTRRRLDRCLRRRTASGGVSDPGALGAQIAEAEGDLLEEADRTGSLSCAVAISIHLYAADLRRDRGVGGYTVSFS